MHACYQFIPWYAQENAIAYNDPYIYQYRYVWFHSKYHHACQQHCYIYQQYHCRHAKSAVSSLFHFVSSLLFMSFPIICTPTSSCQTSVSHMKIIISSSDHFNHEKTDADPLSPASVFLSILFMTCSLCVFFRSFSIHCIDFLRFSFLALMLLPAVSVEYTYSCECEYQCHQRIYKTQETVRYV